MGDTITCPVGCAAGVIGVSARCWRCDGAGVVPASDAPAIVAGTAYRADLRLRGVTLWAEHERLRVAFKTLLLVLYGGLPASELAKRRGEIYITRGRVIADTQKAAEAASRTQPAKRKRTPKSADDKPNLFT